LRARAIQGSLAIVFAPRYDLLDEKSAIRRRSAPREQRNQGARMGSILLWIGRIAGIAGLLLSAWAAVARLQGAFFAGGYQIGTLLLVGMTAMIVACLCLLFVLTARPRQ
jgi:hypothetical protein